MTKAHSAAAARSRRFSPAAFAWTVCCITAFACVATSIAFAQQQDTEKRGAANAEAVILSRGPYLQLSTPTSISILWRTTEATKPVVRFGTHPDQLDQSVPLSSILIRSAPAAGTEPTEPLPTETVSDATPALHSAPAGTVQYEALLSDLQPATKYYYAVFDGSTTLASGAEFCFRTHPKPSTIEPVRIWVLGDSGTGDSRQAAVYKAMQDYVTKQDRPLDLFLHVGDMAYPSGTDAEFQRNFFDVYRSTLQSTVCWAAMGNHEGKTSKGLLGIGPYYDAYRCPTRGEAGGLASASEAYYSFDYANIHFICLDSHDLDRAPTGVMSQWLRADLEATKQDWIIAFWHHPPYTKGSHDSDKEGALIEMRELIMPVLEAGGVDLVLTGHSHIYERSMLIDGAYQTPTTATGVVLDDGDGDPQGDGAYRKSKGLHAHQGTVQVVAGHGGAKTSRQGTSPVMKRVIVENGSTILDVEGDTLTGVMVDRNGATSDLFSIVKRGSVTPKIVVMPRTLPPFTVAIDKAKRKKSDATPFPKNATQLINPHAKWDYLAGKHAAEDWTAIAVIPEESEGWKTGKPGFGYGDGDDVTELKKMKDSYTVVYARMEFELAPGDKEKIAELGLAIAYDDGFIAYINGEEVLRVGVKDGRGANAGDVKSHEADGYEYFPLPDATKLLVDDDNILSVEGHNVSLGSSDFTLDPYLLAVPKKLNAR
ncbi:Alkaline phosphatase precursor [Roseimaritima multifibrata]|uniref:Alkaline phosphatase n=1 Tax=Roseimaritima multifibrata TaxID=1930274 RepID=A0A517MNN6_9BACT|nr:metallophosphoesterase family protein [Roseimaritima multifibrata]QDS96493.1 Alkaline phosphatase precursor [Roseimaritima multifibrata]